MHVIAVFQWDGTVKKISPPAPDLPKLLFDSCLKNPITLIGHKETYYTTLSANKVGAYHCKSLFTGKHQKLSFVERVRR